MRRNNYGSFRKSGAYTSPGTPEHCEEITAGDIVTPKAWCSERVPLPTRRRPVSCSTAAALMPFNNAGRPLPSKWDDAERWITSPVSGHGAFRVRPQRRAKSKSGPLGPAGMVYVSNYGNARNFMVNSPLTTGVLVPDGLSVHYEAGIGAGPSFPCDGAAVNRSNSVPGFGELIGEASAPNSPGVVYGDGMYGTKGGGEGVVSCRDVATQMSPDDSTCSSRLSFANLPAAIGPADKDEVRDVEVDRGVTTAKNRLTNAELDLPAAWNVTEGSKSNVVKLQREEAKIAAWENLQKAKAEAAIRKLEMKLEKKRSASMNKIMHKLRAAQTKAQSMRDSLSEQPHTCSRKTFSCRIYVKKPSLLRCFSCSKTWCLE